MKHLNPSLSGHIAGGATTLCWCWRLRRRDGVVMGFTDHDQDVIFDGTTFEAAAGFTASEIKEAVGLSVDNLAVTGAVSSDRISEADLATGRYDEARVEIYRVNWQAPEQHALMRTGSLGEVKRTGIVFTAEVRGLAHYLSQSNGRLFQYACDATLGDHRCKVALNSTAYSASGSLLQSLNSRTFTVDGLGSYASGWFTQGLLTFNSGAAEGQAIEVKRHSKSEAGVTIELWQPARLPLAPAQQFEIAAGCDKRINTCRDKFANVANFRGFPNMPGNDFLSRISKPGNAL